MAGAACLYGRATVHVCLQGLTAAVRNRLCLAGWTPFPGNRLMDCDFAVLAEGQLCQAEVVECSIELLPPRSAMLIITHHRTALPGCNRSNNRVVQVVCMPQPLQFDPYPADDALPGAAMSNSPRVCACLCGIL